jgi:cell division protein FtsZ
MDAFRSADEVLLSGVQGITDLITTPGLINLDFADVKSVMSGAGSALMGIGSARGDGRAVEAAQKAINSPLLEASMEGAHGVLLAIAGGSDLGLFEINESASLVQESAHPEANIIFGTVIDDSLGDEVRVTVIAAGFDSGTPTHKKLEPTRVGGRSEEAEAPAPKVEKPAAPESTETQHAAPAQPSAPAPAQPAPAQPVQQSAPAPAPAAPQTEQQPPAPQQPTTPQQTGFPQQSPQPSQPQSPQPRSYGSDGSSTGQQGVSVPGRPSGGYPTHSTGASRPGGLPNRAVPVGDDTDDDVDIPPFMRR